MDEYTPFWQFYWFKNSQKMFLYSIVYFLESKHAADLFRQWHVGHQFDSENDS